MIFKLKRQDINHKVTILKHLYNNNYNNKFNLKFYNKIKELEVYYLIRSKRRSKGKIKIIKLIILKIFWWFISIRKIKKSIIIDWY